MKMKKKMAVLGMSLLVLCGTISTAAAYVYTNGSAYQTVTHKDIPAWAGEHYDTYYGSKKVTTGAFATFKKTKGDAALGNFAELITSSKSPKSRLIGIPLNSAQLSTEFSCSTGTVYFSGVTSHNLEPSNSCDVTLKFSADNLK